MTPFDYSQHGEQQAILKFFGYDPVSGPDSSKMRFLDIGAYDGITGSNTRALSDIGWSGLLVEANPKVFFNLQQNHARNEKMTLVNAAVMPHCGLVKFHTAKEDQLGTCLQENHVGEWLNGSIWLSATCPEMLAEQFGDRWDFVSLDIEGMDVPVLERMARLLKHTQLLCVEDYQPNHFQDEDYYKRLLDVCQSHGFNRLIARTGAGIGNTLLARA